MTKTWRKKTRATFGAYDFTHRVVSTGQRAGGQFAIEQPAGARITLAADWFTGNHSLGFVTPGVIVKITSKITFGNRGVLSGNHQFLFELGWNIN